MPPPGFSGLPTASLRIADLLADPFLFAVPPYQRPYSWTITEAGQLLEDVLAAAGIGNADSAEPDYFLGAVLLHSANGTTLGREASAPQLYEIVDGQQRLITLNILACVLRDLEQQDDTPLARRLHALVSRAVPTDARASPFRLELRGRQQSFFERCVLEIDGCGVMPSEAELGETEARIIEVREYFVSELSALDEQERAQLARFLTECCHVVAMLTPDVDRAHRMFLVLNSRGKPLTRNEILKAEILNKVAPDASDRVLEDWDGVAEALGGDEFEKFFSHLRVIHGHYKPQVITGVRTIISDAGGAEPFLASIFVPLAKAYRTVLEKQHTGTRQSDEIRRLLVYLSRLNGTEWIPAAMVALQRYDSDPERVVDMLRHIDRCAHMTRLLCLGSGKRVRRFASIIDAIQSGQPLDGADGPCRFSRDELRTISYNLRDLHSRNQQVCKLVLLRLNDAIGNRFTEIDPGAFSIEHVLPQRIASTSHWRTWFPDSRERETSMQSLGNLLLVTQRQNDRARNESFARKKEIYGEMAAMPVAPLMSMVLEADEWRAEQIKGREAHLLGLLKALWGTGTGGERIKATEVPEGRRVRRRREEKPTS